MKFIKISLFIWIALGLFSCVPISKFNEIKKQSDACSQENETYKTRNEELDVANRELTSRLDQATKENTKLLSDSVLLHRKMNDLQTERNKIEEMYNELKLAQENLTRGNERETTKLLTQLQNAQDKLQKKEDELRKLEWNLDGKRQSLDSLNLVLNRRDAHMKQLERILNRKDSVVKALKDKVSDALLGFEKNGLSVKIKNGKVYVSLAEKLLFKSGSTKVDPGGVSALKKLVKVLEQNPDINIMIEGHTDNVPYRSNASIKDNWDLSVLRATSIVRILLDGSTIDPHRLTAAGKGQYEPIDTANTPEARQKNRRTEIILTPKLNELFKILDTN